MSEMFAPAATALGHSVTAFSTFLPDYAKVRGANPDDPAMTSDVRQGEVAAVVLTVVVGALVSILVRSRIPFLTGIATAVVMVVLYEWALQLMPNPKIKE